MAGGSLVIAILPTFSQVGWLAPILLLLAHIGQRMSLGDRGLGIGTWYNITVATFGGTAPFVITALSNAGHPDAFFWYVAIGAAIGFVATLSLKERKESVLK